tara:strand:- start:15263 stop:16615 length:1353 start_codon:yes stop_codon:yes gene_type:complete
MAQPTQGNVLTLSATPNNSNPYTITGMQQSVGSNGLLVVMVTMRNTVGITSMTFGSNPANNTCNIQYAYNRSGLQQRMEVWYIENADTGSQNLVITFNNNQYNPCSFHMRSYTDCGGIGNVIANNGGSGTPKTNVLNLQQDDSHIMMTSCGVNQILTQQIPQGTNKTFTSHNTYKQVATGAYGTASYLAGNINIRGTATSGNLTVDAVEILGIVATPTITSSPNPVSGMVTFVGAGVSNIVTFVVGLTNSTGNDVLIASSNYFEFSNDGITFVAGILTIPNASLPKTVSVRLKSGLNYGSYYLGNNITSVGASTVSQITSGTVYDVPTTGISPSFRNGMTYVLGNGPSNETTSTLTATDIVPNEDLYINVAGTDFEVSLTSGGTFTQNLTIPRPISGTLNTTLYIRLDQNLPVGNYSTTATFETLGASPKNFVFQGSVTDPSTRRIFNVT